MARVKISAPWVLFYREIEALFKNDPDVRVIFDEEENEVRLYVQNANKADALSGLIAPARDYGNVQLKVKVIPANGSLMIPTGRSLIETALTGNDALSYIYKANGVFQNGITYVVFRNEVVQYFADDLGDVNGFHSTLYQEIAKEVFNCTEGVFFCTDVPEGGVFCKGIGGSLGRPLGEWP